MSSPHKHVEIERIATFIQMKQVEVAICLFDEKYFHVVYFAGIMSKTFGFNEKTNKSEVGRISIWYCLLRICSNNKCFGLRTYCENNQRIF